MRNRLSRRDFVRLAGVGGVAFVSGLTACAADEPLPRDPRAPGLPPTAPMPPAKNDFFFVQMSDTHWGFSGPPNPEADVTLPHAVETLNSVATKPAFVMFTGDLTQTTDDAALRRTRMREFQAITSRIEGTQLRFIPGEHDASLDEGAAYREIFGDLHYAFDHEGVHFVCLDNVSHPSQGLGDVQLAWLEADLAKTSAELPVIVFAHRPLFDLAPEWDWATRDGSKAIEMLEKRKRVTVFYGHIHQALHTTVGSIEHHAARSLVFPLPVAKSQPKKAPLPWDAASADHGIGFREVRSPGGHPTMEELPVRLVSPGAAVSALRTGR